MRLIVSLAVRTMDHPSVAESERVGGAAPDVLHGNPEDLPVSVLCLVAHVSERRLRSGFTSEFDEPPSRFFRHWALGEAHRRLLHADQHTESVTEVASALGFDHLGRFAGRIPFGNPAIDEPVTRHHR